MRRRRTFAAFCVLVLAAATAASVPFAAPTGAGAQTRQCFRTSNWEGASAAGPRDLYVHVNVSEIWHLALAQDCPGAMSAGPVSISDVVTGPTNEICSGVDLQITVKPRGGSHSTACIVKSINKLTPDEIKALPRKARPD
jgi:hypothetical protein